MKWLKYWNAFIKIFLVPFHLAFCHMWRFSWLGRGWTSDAFESLPSGMHFKHFWECSCCGLQQYTYETVEEVQKRFDDYRCKYGDGFVNTDEFSPSKPKL